MDAVDGAGLDFQRVIAAMTVAVDPFADRIADGSPRQPRRPGATVGENVPDLAQREDDIVVSGRMTK